MSNIATVVGSLRSCETNLRAALADAAGKESPERLTLLVGWLKDIQRILAEAEPGTGKMAIPNASPEPVAVGTKRRSAKDYPLFHRENENLVKVGWSKKEREEYEHKAPKSAVLALAAALAEAGRNGRRFTMDKILPLKDPATQSPVPDYQAYLALAWLRGEGLVIQEGRQGYNIAKNIVLPYAVAGRWNQLPPG